MKKTIIITAVITVLSAVILSACGKSGMFEGNVQTSNPWTEYKTLADAEKYIGFSFNVPDGIDDFKINAVRCCNKEIFEVVYENKKNETLRVRKGIGEGDIAGDYNEYGETGQVTIGSVVVTEKGNNGKVSLSTWEMNGYKYVLYTPEMSAEKVGEIIGGIY